MGSGAVSRYELVRIVDYGHVVQVYSEEQRRVSRFFTNYIFVLGVGTVCKNRDKFITPTDRVS